jgi:hypothetical protein
MSGMPSENLHYLHIWDDTWLLVREIPTLRTTYFQRQSPLILCDVTGPPDNLLAYSKNIFSYFWYSRWISCFVLLFSRPILVLICLGSIFFFSDDLLDIPMFWLSHLWTLDCHTCWLVVQPFSTAVECIVVSFLISALVILIRNWM